MALQGQVARTAPKGRIRRPRRSVGRNAVALLFVIGVHFSILHANASAQAYFSPLLVLGLAGTFLVGTAVWVTKMIRYLNRVP